MAVYGWGWTKFGQLGIQTEEEENRVPEPKEVSGLSELCVSGVAAGLAHSAVKSAGWLQTFGKTADGRLGRGSPTTPVGHVAPALRGPCDSVLVVQISCGGGHTSFVDSTGRVFCFGKNDSGQLGTGLASDPICVPQFVSALSGTRAVLVACGAKHTLVATEGMCVYGFGANASGQLGTGSQTSIEPAPVSVDVGAFHSAVTRPVFPLPWPRAVSLAAGNAHSAVAFAGTTVFCWGSNLHGQCGCGSKGGCVTRPEPVCGVLTGKAVLNVSCGDSHTAAVGADGRVYTWGNNEHFQCAQSTVCVLEPAVVRGGALEDALCASVSCGSYHTVAVGAAGDAYAWGLNDYGQVYGSGPQTVRAPYHVRGALRDLRVSAVACGGRHTLALCASTPVVCVPPSTYAADFGSLLSGEGENCGDVCVVLDADGTVMSLHRIFLVRSRVLAAAIEASGDNKICHVDSSIDKPGFYAALKFMYGQEVPPVDSVAAVAAALCIGDLSGPMSASVSQQLLIEHLALCLKSGKLCDTVLVSGDGVKVSAHKAVLAARSQVFRRMLCGPFCESADSGAEVRVPGCSGSGLRAFIHYIYTDSGDVDDVDALDLLEIADMHMLSGFKALCEKRISETVSIEDAAFLYEVAEWYSALQLRSVCECFISSNFSSVLESEAFKDGISPDTRDKILLHTTRFSLLSLAPPVPVPLQPSTTPSSSLSSSSSSCPPSQPGLTNESWVKCCVQ